MSFNWGPQPVTNHAAGMAWQRPPAFFGASQFHQHCPPGPFQYRPPGNGYCAWQSHKLTNRHHNNTSTRPKRPRKEPTFIDYCDVCDRGFKNNAKKEEHYKQHIKCDEPGCSFEAHFKLVAIHKQNLHGPNALRIKVETQEEIERWREERKRRYPSCSNIHRKADKLSMRERQGNVLENKNFSKMRYKKQTVSVNQNSTGQFKLSDDSQRGQSTKQNSMTSKSLLFSSSHDSSGEMSSEDDINDQNTNNLSALGSLMQSYASSSEPELDEDESSIERKPIRASDPFPESDINEVSMEFTSDLNYAKMPVCDTSNFEASSGLQTRDQNKESKPKKQSAYVRGKKRQSLLEMLLASDIRKERNHILQCVRYIVENKFFESDALVTKE